MDKCACHDRYIQIAQNAGLERASDLSWVYVRLLAPSFALGRRARVPVNTPSGAPTDLVLL